MLLTARHSYLNHFQFIESNDQICRLIVKSYADFRPKMLSSFRRVPFLAKGLIRCSSLRSPGVEAPKLSIKVLDESYDRMINSLLDEPIAAEIPGVMNHYKFMLEYNLANGKWNRGAAVIHTFHSFKPKEQCTADEINIAHAVGWSLELSQAAFVVADDMMDRSTIRRGQVCWYKLPQVGLLAVNDVTSLSVAAHRLLDVHCSNHPCYTKLVSLLVDFHRLTSFGQALDMMTSPKPGQKPQMEVYTWERYRMIAKYKTSYYSISHPIRFGLYLAGKSDPEMHKKLEEVLVEVGVYYQAQDDYLDCWGDPNVMGKPGRDINEGKITWLLLETLKICTPEQRKLFIEHYGIDDPESVTKIKQVYEALGIKEKFHVYEQEEYERLTAMIDKFVSDFPEINCKVFQMYLNKLFGRHK